MDRIINKAKPTPVYMPSVYGNTPEMRDFEYPGMCSVEMRDLFPDLPEAKYVQDGDDLSFIRQATFDALDKVDMSMIKAGESVNIACAEHGFVLFGGKPYMEMVKAIYDYVFENTPCADVRVRLVMYRTPAEGTEALEYYNFNDIFGAENVATVCAYDKPVAIQTRIGTLYGLDKAYDGDHFILAYYDDPRELYAHRIYRKAFKAFTMNLARYETRNTYHQAMGDPFGPGSPRNLVPESIYDSDFMKAKWVCGCFLQSAPTGLTGVDADNDLYALDDREAVHLLKDYAYVYHLYQSIDPFNCIIDGGRWSKYMHGGGIVSGTVIQGGYCNVLDLNAAVDSLPNGVAAPGLKTIILNQAWWGLTNSSMMGRPTYVVGRELQELYDQDPTNSLIFAKSQIRVDTLDEAIKSAVAESGTDRFLCFDGSFGFVNCTESMANALYDNAPMIGEKVRNELYPMYLRQRGLEEWVGKY